MNSRCSASRITPRAEQQGVEAPAQEEGVAAAAAAAAEAATNASLQAPDGLDPGMCMDTQRREHINTDLCHQLPRF